LRKWTNGTPFSFTALNINAQDKGVDVLINAQDKGVDVLGKGSLEEVSKQVIDMIPQNRTE